ncbi:uncharacterized protein LOC111832052 [Capsella rubella]|uniref:uncharacterized protein LOC111832052 n=1 Tax=Capsella rubella TaxID=81985 RepID=UPI000CD592D2|nr:uncharacterized protein LOC111832052 [Capsella rubella]
MAEGRSNLNFQVESTKNSGDQENFPRQDCPVGLSRHPQTHGSGGEASQKADLAESKLVDVKQGTKTVSEYLEEFLEKSKTLERECDEEELAWMFQRGLRQELQEGVRAANCGWILCYVSDVAYEAELIEAKLESTKGKLPLVFDESTNVECGQNSSKDEA